MSATVTDMDLYQSYLGERRSAASQQRDQSIEAVLAVLRRRLGDRFRRLDPESQFSIAAEVMAAAETGI